MSIDTLFNLIFPQYFDNINTKIKLKFFIFRQRISPFKNILFSTMMLIDFNLSNPICSAYEMKNRVFFFCQLNTITRRNAQQIQQFSNWISTLKIMRKLQPKNTDSRSPRSQAPRLLLKKPPTPPRSRNSGHQMDPYSHSTMNPQQEEEMRKNILYQKIKNAEDLAYQYGDSYGAIKQMEALLQHYIRRSGSQARRLEQAEVCYRLAMLLIRTSRDSEDAGRASSKMEEYIQTMTNVSQHQINEGKFLENVHVFAENLFSQGHHSRAQYFLRFIIAQVQEHYQIHRHPVAYVRAHRQLGLVQQMEGHRAEAEISYQHGLSVSRSQRKTSNTESIQAMMLELENAELLFNLGVLYQSQSYSKLPAAKACYSEAIENLQKIEKYSNREQLAQNSERMSELLCNLYNNYSNLLVREDKYQEGLHPLEEAIRRKQANHTQDPEIYANHANLLSLLSGSRNQDGRWKKTLLSKQQKQYMDNAMKQYQNAYRSFLKRAEKQLSLDYPDLKQVQTDCMHALEAFEVQDKLRTKIMNDRPHSKRKEQHENEEYENEFGVWRVHYYLALVYEGLGSIDEAENQLILSKDWLPNTITYPEFRVILAIIYSKMGQIAQQKPNKINNTTDLYHRLAFDLIQKAPSNLYTQVYILYQYAMYLLRVGDTSGKASTYLNDAYNLIRTNYGLKHPQIAQLSAKVSMAVAQQRVRKAKTYQYEESKSQTYSHILEKVVSSTTTKVTTVSTDMNTATESLLFWEPGVRSRQTSRGAMLVDYACSILTELQKQPISNSQEFWTKIDRVSDLLTEAYTSNCQMPQLYICYMRYLTLRVHHKQRHPSEQTNTRIWMDQINNINKAEYYCKNIQDKTVGLNRRIMDKLTEASICNMKACSIVKALFSRHGMHIQNEGIGRQQNVDQLLNKAISIVETLLRQHPRGHYHSQIGDLYASLISNICCWMLAPVNHLPNAKLSSTNIRKAIQFIEEKQKHYIRHPLLGRLINSLSQILSQHFTGPKEEQEQLAWFVLVSMMNRDKSTSVKQGEQWLNPYIIDINNQGAWIYVCSLWHQQYLIMEEHADKQNQKMRKNPLNIQKNRPQELTSRDRSGSSSCSSSSAEKGLNISNSSTQYASARGYTPFLKTPIHPYKHEPALPGLASNPNSNLTNGHYVTSRTPSNNNGTTITKTIVTTIHKNAQKDHPTHSIIFTNTQPNSISPTDYQNKRGNAVQSINYNQHDLPHFIDSDKYIWDEEAEPSVHDSTTQEILAQGTNSIDKGYHYHHTLPQKKVSFDSRNSRPVEQKYHGGSILRNKNSRFSENSQSKVRRVKSTISPSFAKDRRNSMQLQNAQNLAQSQRKQKLYTQATPQTTKLTGEQKMSDGQIITYFQTIQPPKDSTVFQGNPEYENPEQQIVGGYRKEPPKESYYSIPQDYTAQNLQATQPTLINTQESIAKEPIKPTNNTVINTTNLSNISNYSSSTNRGLRSSSAFRNPILAQREVVQEHHLGFSKLFVKKLKALEAGQSSLWASPHKKYKVAGSLNKNNLILAYAKYLVHFLYVHYRSNPRGQKLVHKEEEDLFMRKLRKQCQIPSLLTNTEIRAKINRILEVYQTPLGNSRNSSVVKRTNLTPPKKIIHQETSVITRFYQHPQQLITAITEAVQKIINDHDFIDIMGKQKGHVWQHYPSEAYNAKQNKKRLKKLLQAQDLAIVNMEAQQALVDSALIVYEMGDGTGQSFNNIYEPNPIATSANKMTQAKKKLYYEDKSKHCLK